VAGSTLLSPVAILLSTSREVFTRKEVSCFEGSNCEVTLSHKMLFFVSAASKTCESPDGVAALTRDNK